MAKKRKALTQYSDYYDMLSDDVRMQAYEKAISEKVKVGDIVVDLGAGTGILGFLALRAGASKVYSIEKSDAIDLAEAVAERNGFSDSIVFLNENSKDVELPEKADIIISETLGVFGLDESTLDFTVDARQRMLKPDGILLPQSLELELAPVEASHCQKKLDFWKSVQGIDFGPAREVFSRKIMNEEISSDLWLADPATFGHVNFYEVENDSYTNKVLFHFKRSGTVHGIAGWFKLHLTDKVNLSTSPKAPATHWKQAFFPLQETVQVIAGDIMEFTMQISPKEELSDDTCISYNFRCTQIAKNPPLTPRNQAQTRVKVGRNEPCPCGSGLKYKKCCG